MGRPILPLNGLTAAYMALPTLFSTFAKHYLSKSHSDQKARDELGFDEAFALAKFFVEKSSQYTVEDIQRMGNGFVPAPWTVRVIRVAIPASTSSIAAQYLIDAFGPDELQHVIGGQLWWQSRGYKDGAIEAEWIAMKTDWKRVEPRAGSSSPCSKSNTPAQLHPTPGSPTDQYSSPAAEPLRKRDSVLRQFRRLSGRKVSPAHSTNSTTDPITASDHTPGPSNSASSPNDPPVAAFEYTDEPGSPAGNEDFTNGAYEGDMDTMRCMLYIHGGAYYFGSVNTHRYCIWRYARKMGGRAFAVNYRLAPQYPFPCALADCLAAYLYLIRPPLEAKHRPVDPSKLIIAGDSAGGGLSLALLTLIRDCGLPAPAGAVLISPWVDLTHSFPSVMDNTKTDIIPPYGFMHQPSTLWPPPPAEQNQEPPDAPQASSSVKPSPSSKLDVTRSSSTTKRFSLFGSISKKTKAAVSTSSMTADALTTLSPDNVAGANDLTAHVSESQPTPGSTSYVNPYGLTTFQDLLNTTNDHQVKLSAPTSSTRFVQIDGKKVEINQQIQLYATNDQLTHPYCSPALSPSLGGLPPLFILAGDKEVLRDEIVYVAHRAAHPERYPLREDLANAHPARQEQAKHYPPTKVHLQIYDDMCHVLPMFAFARPAKYCYRAIASFCKFVTVDSDHITTPSPLSHPDVGVNEPNYNLTVTSPRDFTINPDSTSAVPAPKEANDSPSTKPTSSSKPIDQSILSTPDPTPLNCSLPPKMPVALHTTGGTPSSSEGSRVPSLATSPQAPSTWGRVTGGSADTHRSELNQSNSSDSDQRSSASEARVEKNKEKLHPKLLAELKETIYHSALPFNRPDYVDGMIRERVDVFGRVRPLEPESDLPALSIDHKTVGVIKEGPVRRWVQGKQIWDHKFMSKYKRIQYMREHNIKRAAEENKQRIKERVKEKRKSTSMLLTKQDPVGPIRRNSMNADTRELNNYELHRSLRGLHSSMITENPPPSSIAARRDTSEARKLAKAVDEQVHIKGHPMKILSGLHGFGAGALRNGADSPPVLDETRSITPDHSNVTTEACDSQRLGPGQIHIAHSESGSSRPQSTLSIPPQPSNLLLDQSKMQTEPESL